MVDPVQTPFPSGETQLPFKLTFPAPQMIQSLDVGPEQVEHKGEHTVHEVPLLKLPSGQV